MTYLWNLDITSLKVNVSSFEVTLHDESYLLKSKRKCSFAVSLKKNVSDFCRVRIEQILCKLWMNVEQIVSRFTRETIPDFEFVFLWCQKSVRQSVPDSCAHLSPFFAEILLCDKTEIAFLETKNDTKC